ncbi:hypothetical protein FDZ66_04125 [Ehrlichia ruminantium]|nr:hypothetical protein FDZ68_04125 [Ehrlichia ruminantium]QLK51740.1 hypothetical protein FDZ66_04125 [Ehrlichia ruminantium]
MFFLFAYFTITLCVSLVQKLMINELLDALLGIIQAVVNHSVNGTDYSNSMNISHNSTESISDVTNTEYSTVTSLLNSNTTGVSIANTSATTMSPRSPLLNSSVTSVSVIPYEISGRPYMIFFIGLLIICFACLIRLYVTLAFRTHHNLTGHNNASDSGYGDSINDDNIDDDIGGLSFVPSDRNMDLPNVTSETLFCARNINYGEIDCGNSSDGEYGSIRYSSESEEENENDNVVINQCESGNTENGLRHVEARTCNVSSTEQKESCIHIPDNPQSVSSVSSVCNGSIIYETRL